MERPPPPPLAPGRPGLPAFREVEAALEREASRTRGEIEARSRAAEDEALRIRREGETRLKEVLREAQVAALRQAEDRARERVNEARARIQRWVDAAEEATRDALGRALDLCAEG